LNVPSKEWPPNSDLRRAPLLAAQVEIEIAGGHIERARSAADELTRVAAVFESKALAAAAVFARGQVRLAAGDMAAARGDFETAVHQWGEIGAPYETGLGRMGLAHAHRAEGNEAHAILEVRAAHVAFERIGAVSQAARAADAMGERPRDRLDASTSLARPTVAGSAHRDADNVFRREGDYWLLAFEGQIVRLRDMRGVQYLARLLGSPGREFHVVDLVAVAQVSPAGSTHVADRACGMEMQAMPARCSMRAPRTRTAGGSQRLRTIWRKREHWGTHHGRRRQRPNGISSRASCPVLLDSEDAIDASVLRQSAPEPV